MPSELGQAFDLPAFVNWSPAFVQELVPLHLFRVVLDAVLQKMPVVELEDRKVCTRRDNLPDGGQLMSRCKTRSGYLTLVDGCRAHGQGHQSPTKR